MGLMLTTLLPVTEMLVDVTKEAFLLCSYKDKAFDFLNHMELFGIVLLVFSDQVITCSLLMNFLTYVTGSVAVCMPQIQ